jgi:hypothetical protein
MNESEYHELQEKTWRQPLDATDEARLQAYLVAHPDAHAEWEAESGLNNLLGHLPPAPLASNFTAQVLQAIQHEAEVCPRRLELPRWLARWVYQPVPRLAWACVFGALVFLGHRQYQIYTQNQMVKGLVAIMHASDLKDPAVFKDLDAIRLVSQIPPTGDEELWLTINQSPK